MRFDQELACDATVSTAAAGRTPALRRDPAAQPGRGHRLAAGMRMEGRPSPRTPRRPPDHAVAAAASGDFAPPSRRLAVAALWAAAFTGGWITQPPYRLPEPTQDPGHGPDAGRPVAAAAASVRQAHVVLGQGGHRGPRSQPDAPARPVSILRSKPLASGSACSMVVIHQEKRSASHTRLSADWA